MFCPTCNNILIKKYNNNVLKFFCETCGSEFDTTGTDTMMFNEDKEKFSVVKDGRIIFFYPANHKVFKQCESKKCNKNIVAWEQDSDMNKIYGCECGYSWKETY